MYILYFIIIIITIIIYHLRLPVVPHKAVAEVSE
jgi:hypothetical protein